MPWRFRRSDGQNRRMADESLDEVDRAYRDLAEGRITGRAIVVMGR